MGDRRKLHDEVRDRLTEVVGIQLADDVMEVLADYRITRKGADFIPGGAVNMVISQPQQPQGFSRWNLEEAYQHGLHRGRTGG